MAQENDNRLHAYINIISLGGGVAVVAGSGGVDLTSIVVEDLNRLTLRLTQGLSDAECFYALGSNAVAGQPAILAVTRIPDPAENFFRLTGGTIGDLAGSISWWSVPIQGAFQLPPAPP